MLPSIRDKPEKVLLKDVYFLPNMFRYFAEYFNGKYEKERLFLCYVVGIHIAFVFDLTKMFVNVMFHEDPLSQCWR